MAPCDGEQAGERLVDLADERELLGREVVGDQAPARADADDRRRDPRRAEGEAHARSSALLEDGEGGLDASHLDRCARLAVHHAIVAHESRERERRRRRAGVEVTGQYGELRGRVALVGHAAREPLAARPPAAGRLLVDGLDVRAEGPRRDRERDSARGGGSRGVGLGHDGRDHARPRGRGEHRAHGRVERALGIVDRVQRDAVERQLIGELRVRAHRHGAGLVVGEPELDGNHRPCVRLESAPGGIERQRVERGGERGAGGDRELALHEQS